MSFQRVWETLRCSFYDLKNEQLPNYLLFTMAVNSMSWSFQKSSKLQNSCLSRNFLRQGSFLGIRELQETIIYNTKKKAPQGKVFSFFSCKLLKIVFLVRNLTYRWHKRIFLKIRALFSNFWKRTGETSLRNPSSYALAKCGSDNKKTLPICFCEIPYSGHLSLANILSVALFQRFFILFFKTISPVIKIKSL